MFFYESPDQPKEMRQCFGKSQALSDDDNSQTGLVGH